MKRLLSIIFILVFYSVSGAETFPQVPQRVNDFANVLSPTTETALKKILKQLDMNTTIELIVVTVASLEGKSIEQYSIELGKRWRIGKKDKNNGIFFIVAPKERKVRLEVGYGLEHILTDAITKRILRESASPHFKIGDFDKGCISGVSAIINTIKQSSR